MNKKNPIAPEHTAVHVVLWRAFILFLLILKKQSWWEELMNAGFKVHKSEDILDLSNKTGFHQSIYVTADEIYNRYFTNRSDGLRVGNAEAFLVVKT